MPTPTLPRVIIISIPNSPRRAHIQAVFNNIGLPFEFHDAVNGKELSPEILAKVDQDYARHEWGQTLTKGEIGCAASHIQVYEKIIAQGLSEAIILEDDAQPSEDFIQNLQELFRALPKRAEIAFLHHGKAKSWPFKQNLANGKKLVRYRYPSAKSRRFIVSCMGYWINQAGAQKLMKLAYPIRMPADFLTGYIQRNRIHAYGVEPNLINETNIPSEIDAIEMRQT